MIDFETGIKIPVSLHKTKKQIYEKINDKTINDEMTVFFFKFREGTAKDEFISHCLEELEFCYRVDYELKGIEFISYAPYPIGKHLRVFFSEASETHNDFHFFIMTADYNDTLEALCDGEEARNFEIKILSREEEELHPNV